MRPAFIFAITLSLLLIFGCTFQKTPLHGEAMSISQNDTQVMLTVHFTGNDVPERVSGKMTLVGKDGTPIYNREFFVKNGDFSVIGNQTVLTRQIILEKNESIAYANLTLALPKETFYAEQGKEQSSGIGYITLDPISHETQYAINVKIFDADGKQVTAAKGNISISINDADGELYRSQKTFDERQFSGNFLSILVPYSQVKKSFYDNGSVSVNMYLNGNKYNRNTGITLRKYSGLEMLAMQENEFARKAVTLDNTTNYVGFRFYVKDAGFYVDYTPNKKELIRFDAVLTNAKPQHQYLVRDDFYMKDEDKMFYAVDSGRSTTFGPLLLKGAIVNATFYFEKRANKGRYIFYYGDKILAVFQPE